MKTMKVCDIEICDDFLTTTPSDKKIAKALKHINKFNKIDKPVVLHNGVLVDGYTRYLAALIKGMQEVPYVELQKMNYIVGKFDNCDKEYVWKNDKNINIKIGDRVSVESREARSNDDNKTMRLYVTVVDKFYSDSLDLYNKHRRVLKKLNNK